MDHHNHRDGLNEQSHSAPYLGKDFESFDYLVI